MPPDTPRSLNGVRVLVVEDHEDSRIVFEQCLLLEGATVLTAPSARRAVAMLTEHDFDIVLTDYAMPGETGVWLLARVREHSSRIPVVVITGYHDADVRHLRHASFARVLRKPVGADELCHELIAALLESDTRF
jgi:CheY-like chemotaxis protein